MFVEGVGKSHTGPREKNEDAFGLFIPKSAKEMERLGVVAVVADGVGGNPGGDIASKLAVETVIKYFVARASNPKEALLESFLEAHRVIKHKAEEDPNFQGMATTCTAVAVKNSKLYIAHVGDSRAYLFRNDDLVRITQDHALPNSAVLTNALGIKGKPYIELHELDLQAGDTFLVCTDGLYKPLSHEEMERHLKNQKELKLLVDNLTQLALDKGSRDNVTLVALRYTTS